MGIATDLGKYNEYIVGNLQNLDALLLEANHETSICCRLGALHHYETENPWRQGHLSMRMQAGFMQAAA